MSRKESDRKENCLKRLSVAAFLMLTAFTIHAGPSNQDEDFRWQDAVQDVINLPFKQSYIDSVKKHHNVTFSQSPLRQVIKPNFCQGETLVYEISWGPFRAGYIVLTADPDLKTRTLKIGGKALSNNFVSAFYRMRDYIISTVDLDGLYPLFFEQHLREGKKFKADGYILYDHSAEKIYVQERKFKSMSAPKYSHDYLSMLYYVRSMKFAPGDTFILNLFLHSKINPVYFQCKEKKSIQVDAGTFSCVLLEPRFTGDGKTFNKKDKLEVWLTDDEAKIPVLIKSKIKVGAVNAKLVWRTTAKKAPPVFPKPVLKDSTLQNNQPSDSSVKPSDPT